MSLRCLVLVLLFAPMAAWGAQSPGIRLYERGAYARAIRVLKDEANNPRRSEEQRALARVYLAASLMALEKGDEARRQLEELVRTYPEQRVDPALFPPELVELERLVRAEVETERLRKEAEQAERERLAAEAERQRLAAEEAERRRREGEVVQQTPRGPEVEVQEPAVAEAGASWRFRPEATAFTDAMGFVEGPKRSFGLGLGLTVGSGMVEGTGRFLLGVGKGAELEAGLVFGEGAFKPRLGLRGTGVWNLRVDPLNRQSGESWALGGGPVVGARLVLASGLTVMVDGGLEFFLYFDKISSTRYRSPVVMLSAGLGFDLL